MKKRIEKWAIKKLYLYGFPNHARISKIKKRVIFHPMTWVFFKIFAEPKAWICIWVLKNLCGYSFYEVRWCPWIKQNAPQRHTKGEILDIIWSYKEIPRPKLKPIKPHLSELSKESPLNE